MKKLIIAFAALGFIHTGCDKVSESEYLQNVVIDSVDNGKKVLVEDYTGQKCGNCPQANEIAADIKSTYGERAVVIEVHAGFFAKPSPAGEKFRTDFRSPAGDELDAFFGISIAGNPNGMVNRLDYQGNHIKAKDSWKTIVSTELAKAPVATLEIAKNYNEANRTVSFTVSSKFLENYTEPTKLVVYLIEDSLSGWQSDYRLPSGSQDVENYMHRHVLRGALNSTFGEDFTTLPVAKDYERDEAFTAVLPETYIAKNCSLVAILYKASNYEVMNVEEIHIVK